MGAASPSLLRARIGDVLAEWGAAQPLERELVKHGIYLHRQAGDGPDERPHIVGIAEARRLAQSAGVCLHKLDHALRVPHECLRGSCVNNHWYHFSLDATHLTLWTEWCSTSWGRCPSPRPAWVARVLTRWLRRLLDANRRALREELPHLRPAGPPWPRWTHRRTRHATPPEVLLGEARWLHVEDGAGTLKTGSDPPPGNESFSTMAQRTQGRQA